MRLAGELRIPFTTGILVGIGESPEERIGALEAIAELQAEYGHIQEVILQNFVPHPRYYGAEVADIADQASRRAGPARRTPSPGHGLGRHGGSPGDLMLPTSRPASTARSCRRGHRRCPSTT